MRSVLQGRGGPARCVLEVPFLSPVWEGARRAAAENGIKQKTTVYTAFCTHKPSFLEIVRPSAPYAKESPPSAPADVRAFPPGRTQPKSSMNRVTAAMRNTAAIATRDTMYAAAFSRAALRL